mmetsp:Transcript_43307/g.123466  ORF Transcript_43307/g.123466 Transcript_43307/m.123466 type:complete len:353 (-) Transcript_43307:994-2052(-)
MCFAHIRGHEEIAVIAPVGKAGVEHIPEEVLVLILEKRARATIDVGPERVASGELLESPHTLLARGLRKVETAEVQIDTPGLHQGGRRHDAPGHDGAAVCAAEKQRVGRLAGAGLHRRGAEVELVEAELHAAVDATSAHAHALFRIQDLAVLKLNLGGDALVPELRDLEAGQALGLRRKVEPGLLKIHLRVQEVLGQHRGLGQLTQVVDYALSLSDQVKILGEGFGILDQWVVSPRQPSVLHAAVSSGLLPRLDTHPDVRRQHTVIRQIDPSLLHHKPLASAPLFVEAFIICKVETTLHADDWLFILAHRELLQVVVRLEEHVPDARASQPLGLETFHLHAVLGDLWIQGVE